MRSPRAVNRHQHLPAVLLRAAALHQALLAETVDQLNRTVMPNLEAFGKFPHRGLYPIRQPFQASINW